LRAPATNATIKNPREHAGVFILWRCGYGRCHAIDAAGYVYVWEENDEQKLASILRATKNAPRRGKLATCER
jgi:hypothetical protein